VAAVGSHRRTSSGEITSRLKRICERLLAVLRADLDAVSGDEFEIFDPDETEDAAQIGLQVLERRHRGIGTVMSAARDRDDHALVAGEPLWTVRAVGEGLARDRDAIDPGFQLARN
jgi:hypothetical protein